MHVYLESRLPMTEKRALVKQGSRTKNDRTGSLDGAGKEDLHDCGVTGAVEAVVVLGREAEDEQAALVVRRTLRVVRVR